MISIILPSYNGQKYIEQAIESVINQTFSDWELIIVDDCSTDDTLSIVKEYAKKDCRIKVIHNDSNQKLPQSLNIGFQNASGEYYTWISDDNAFALNALERMYQILTDKNVDFVFADYETIDPEDYIIYRVHTGPIEILPLRDTVGACFLYRRQVHDILGGYDINKFLVEDYDFWLRAYWKFKFYHIKESLYYYRIHGGSLTATKKENVEKATIELIKENLPLIPDSDGKLREQVKKKIESQNG